MSIGSFTCSSEISLIFGPTFLLLADYGIEIEFLDLVSNENFLSETICLRL
jgi:hypothetical protein